MKIESPSIKSLDRAERAVKTISVANNMINVAPNANFNLGKLLGNIEQHSHDVAFKANMAAKLLKLQTFYLKRGIGLPSQIQEEDPVNKADIIRASSISRSTERLKMRQKQLNLKMERTNRKSRRVE